MIKTVLFDLGNVILPFDVTRLAGRLSRHCSLSINEIVERLWSDGVADLFETGKMSPREYFAHVAQLCEFKNLSFEEFVPIFNEIFDENTEVIDIIARLRARYKLGLISNTNPIHVPYVMDRYAHLQNFEQHWWSNEAGVRKPDPKIYQLALDHFDVEPGEAVFVDDLVPNIESARKMGIRGIVFTGAGPLKAELSQLGVQY